MVSPMSFLLTLKIPRRLLRDLTLKYSLSGSYPESFSSTAPREAGLEEAVWPSLVTLSFTQHVPLSSPGTNHHAVRLSTPCTVPLISGPSKANLREEEKAKHPSVLSRLAKMYHFKANRKKSCTILFQKVHVVSLLTT